MGYIYLDIIPDPIFNLCKNNMAPERRTSVTLYHRPPEEKDIICYNPKNKLIVSYSMYKRIIKHLSPDQGIECVIETKKRNYFIYHIITGFINGQELEINEEPDSICLSIGSPQTGLDFTALNSWCKQREKIVDAFVRRQKRPYLNEEWSILEGFAI